jgi:hypothetical protein
MQGAMAEAAAGGTGDMAQTTLPPEVAGMAPATGAAPIPSGMASESSGGFQHKSAQSDEFDKSEMAIERWSEILSRGIERVVERQQRVVLEKASSSKSKKALMSGTLDLDSIFSIDTWNKQLEDDLRPVISAIVNDSYEFRKESYSQKGLKPRALSPAIVKKHIDSQISEILTMNSGIRSSMEEMMMKLLTGFSMPARTTKMEEIEDNIENDMYIYECIIFNILTGEERCIKSNLNGIKVEIVDFTKEQENEIISNLKNSL